MCINARNSRCLAFVSAILIATCVSAFAHDPGLSSANLKFTATAMHLQLTYNERDIAAVTGATIEELKSRTEEGRRKLDLAARRAIILRVDRKPLTAASITADTDDNNNVEFDYRFDTPQGPAEFALESVLLQELAFGHRQAFAAVDEGGNEIARQILSARESRTTFQHGGSPAPGSAGSHLRFTEFFLLGVRHILTGYDHLLFLFGLLVVCGTLRSALLLITSFTVAHSLTLALSTFGVVDLPSRFIEATIAASILFVGIENIVRGDGILRGRCLLTFVFGLIHGLGFASVLHEMGIAKEGVGAVIPLVAFNSGIEGGQLVIAAVVLPIIWQLRCRPLFLRFGIPIFSLLVAAAGAFWLLERTLLG